MKCKIQYVVEDVDRHGNVRVYFRKRGCKKIHLPNKIGTSEFWTAYNNAASNKLPVAQSPVRAGQSKPGTMRAWSRRITQVRNTKSWTLGLRMYDGAPSIDFARNTANFPAIQCCPGMFSPCETKYQKRQRRRINC